IVAASRGGKGGKKSPEEKANKAEQRKANADKRAANAPLKKKINDVEALTQKLQRQIHVLDKELEDQEIYDKFPDKAAAKVKERAEVMAKITKSEEQWMILSDEYEAAMAG
ncbi:MAG: ABC transporter ATP-binding protein, partial [Rhizobium sp.]